MLSGEGVYADPRKISAIIDMPVPKNKVELQRFLGMCNYLGKFIPDLANVTASLRCLLEKDIPWHFEAEQENAVKKLKEMVTSAPVLKYFLGLFSAKSLPNANLSSFDPSAVTGFARKFNHPDCKLNFPPITPEQTQQIIESSPSSKATGADELSVRLLKIAAPSIASSLAKLINLCIAKRTFPSLWKQARVVPLHKCGSKSDKNNYRPISVLPILSKVFQRHLFNALHNFLSSNNLLYNLQSGFRGHHSTETALMIITIIDRALNNLDNNCINGFIFADFKKAFDFVDHDVLLEKLRLYDLDDSSLYLMRSYLTSRKQFTTVKNVSSPLRELTHGVPQGSVLAPLLFLIFISDLPEAFTPSTTVDIFADDTTLSNSATWNEVGTLKNDLGNSILLLEDWSKQKRQHLNIKKTKSMLITGKRLGSKLLPEDLSLDIKTRNNTKLDQTLSHKLLGVHLDQDLNFDEHVDSMCNKLSKRIGLLRSIKHLLPKQERIILYNSIIKPILMYGSVVWTKTSNENIRRVFRLQKRAARVILNVGLREERTVTI